MLSGRYCSLSWNVVGTLLCALVWCRKCFTSLMVSITHMKSGRTSRDILRYAPTQGMRAWNISHVKVGDALSSFSGGFWNAVIRSEKPRVSKNTNYKPVYSGDTRPPIQHLTSVEAVLQLLRWRWGFPLMCSSSLGFPFRFFVGATWWRGWHMWICLDVLWNLGGIITLYLLLI